MPPKAKQPADETMLSFDAAQEAHSTQKLKRLKRGRDRKEKPASSTPRQGDRNKQKREQKKLRQENQASSLKAVVNAVGALNDKNQEDESDSESSESSVEVPATRHNAAGKKRKTQSPPRSPNQGSSSAPQLVQASNGLNLLAVVKSIQEHKQFHKVLSAPPGKVEKELKKCLKKIKKDGGEFPITFSGDGVGVVIPAGQAESVVTRHVTSDEHLAFSDPDFIVDPTMATIRDFYWARIGKDSKSVCDHLYLVSEKINGAIFHYLCTKTKESQFYDLSKSVYLLLPGDKGYPKTPQAMLKFLEWSKSGVCAAFLNFTHFLMCLLVDQVHENYSVGAIEKESDSAVYRYLWIPQECYQVLTDFSFESNRYQGGSSA